MTTEPLIVARRTKVLRFILARAQEPSSWRGLILLLSGLGAAIEPTLAAKIIAVGVSFAGAVGLLVGDAATPAEGN